MPNSPALVQPPSKSVPPLPERIPITYLWFGKEVPEDYLISLAELNYPVQFLKNPHISRKFTREILDIEKSDYYRLQYLYDYGGIYSDFDNIIDYNCLMKLLQPYRTQDKLVFMTNPMHNRAKNREMTNNLIFAPYAGMPILKKMLDSVNEKKGKIWNFSGMKFVASFKEPLEVNMDKCVKHTGDWSWFDASNEVLKKKTQPHSRYSQKLLKKKDILGQNAKLEFQIKSLGASQDKLSKQLAKIKSENAKIKEEMGFSNTEVAKQARDKIKNSDEHSSQDDTENGVELTQNSEEMRSQIQYLMQKSDKLYGQKDSLLMISGGVIAILFMLIVAAILLLRKTKGPGFSPVVETSRTFSEQN